MHQSAANEKRRGSAPQEESGVDFTPPVIHMEAFDFRPVKSKAMANTEFEYSMIRAGHAFEHWIACGMAAVGMQDLAVIDFLVLNEVHHQATNKKLADICFILNIEDAHVVGYSLRKLIRLGIIKADKPRNEVTYSTTALGRTYFARYQEIREQCLLHSINTLGLDKTALKQLAQFLCKMSGLYDQAARAASSLSLRKVNAP